MRYSCFKNNTVKIIMWMYEKSAFADPWKINKEPILEKVSQCYGNRKQVKYINIEKTDSKASKVGGEHICKTTKTQTIRN